MQLKVISVKNATRQPQNEVTPALDGNEKVKRRRSSWAFEPIDNSEKSSGNEKPGIPDVVSSSVPPEAEINEHLSMNMKAQVEIIPSKENIPESLSQEELVELERKRQNEENMSKCPFFAVLKKAEVKDVIEPEKVEKS